jgi:hypothetical protein
MALFFQLVSPDALKDLTPGQIEALKAAFYRELHTNATIRDELTRRIDLTLRSFPSPPPPSTPEPDKPDG